MGGEIDSSTMDADSPAVEIDSPAVGIDWWMGKDLPTEDIGSPAEKN